jgi:hypothetical protein
MQRWRHRRKPTCGRLIGQASKEFHPQHKDFCQQRSHLLPRQLKKAASQAFTQRFKDQMFQG